MPPSRRDFLAMLGVAVTSSGFTDDANPAVTRTSGHAEAVEYADDICFTGGRELARLIRTRKLSAREVMLAHLRQIERTNPKINAIVAKLDDAQCVALADAADRRIAQSGRVGPLHGLPFAFKDTEAAVGFPFTRGSPIYRNFMPTADSVVVERLRNAGVLAIGKTNIPEFGMGSHTYNRVTGSSRACA